MKTDTVLVPVDFSEQSFAAVDKAIELAGDASHVHVVHVLPEMNIADPGVIWSAIDDTQRSKHAIQGLRENLAGAIYDGLNFHVEIGDPGHRSTEYAAQIKADLIVLPSHGRTGLAKWLIGSVAERVVRLAPCPVLVLRG